MADDLKYSDFSTGEKLRMAGLGLRAIGRGLAGGLDLKDLKRRAERIEKQAERRKNGK
ncbi:DUF6257 family protein [Streptomyces chartreusis]|uniref:DUF6257 family protein n=1 Tax=Streptomyces chartreusis TaxID=1969 RepID=UPI0036DDC1DA